MNRLSVLILTASVIVNFQAISTSAAEHPRYTWTAEETAPISVEDCRAIPGGKWLNTEISDNPHFTDVFPLFYTLNQPFNPGLPTVLFVDGGPGAIVTPSRQPNLGRFSNAEWNVVQFHIRGAGCSYFPFSTAFDLYLTSHNVIHDMEALRLSLGINKWDVVLGESFGSWLARAYVVAKPEAARTLVVEGVFNPILDRMAWKAEAMAKSDASKRMFLQMARAHPEWLNPALSEMELISIGARLDVIFAEIEFAAASTGFYPGVTVSDPERADAIVEQLHKYKQYFWTAYGPEFFQAVYLSEYIGTQPLTPILASEQKAATIAVLNAFFPGRVTATDLNAAKWRMQQGLAFANESSRLYPVISTRANVRFYRDLFRAPQIEPSSVPTLFLNGSLDGATPLQAARMEAKCKPGVRCAFVTVEGGGHSATNLPGACVGQTLLKLVHDGVGAAVSTLTESSACHLPNGKAPQVESL